MLKQYRRPIAARMFVLMTLAASQVSAQETVIIGGSAPLTGNLAHLGKDEENGARLAVEEINAQNIIIAGKPLRLTLDMQDDAADPRTATLIAQRFVDENVVAVVGPLNSGAAIPTSKIFNDGKIAQITTATNPKFTLQGFKTTFRVVATDAQQGPALATYVSGQLRAKNVAVVDDATAYGQGLADEFVKAAKSLGINVVSRDSATDKTVDFRAILTKIKGENPDAIMYGGSDGTSGPFVRQLKQLGLRAKVVSGDGTCTEKFPDLAGPGADNVVCSEASVALEKMPGGGKFQEKFVKRFGQPTQQYAPFFYDAVYVFVNAMKSANSTDAVKILAAMPETKYDGVIGPIEFDQKGDLKHGSISLFTFKGGKKTLLDEVKL